MKKMVLILSSVLLVSSPVYACPGSENAKVDFNTKVKFSAAKVVSHSALKAGSVFKVKGMECSNCVKKVESAVSGVKGVKSVKVDLKNAKAMIVFNTNADQKSVSDKIIKAVEKSGFKASKI